MMEWRRARVEAEQIWCLGALRRRVEASDALKGTTEGQVDSKNSFTTSLRLDKLQFYL